LDRKNSQDAGNLRFSENTGSLVAEHYFSRQN
jgi:hypothetical protein